MVKLFFSDHEAVLSKYNLSSELKQAIIDVVNVKMIPHPVKIKAECRLTCYTMAGIDDIKASLKEGELLSTKEIPVKIRIISSPLYEISTETVKRNDGLKLISEVVKKIEQAIKLRSGNFVLSTKVSNFILLYKLSLKLSVSKESKI